MNFINVLGLIKFENILVASMLVKVTRQPSARRREDWNTYKIKITIVFIALKTYLENEPIV